MVVVDSSVWIAHLRGAKNDATRKLTSLDLDTGLLVGDLILLEVLQGALRRVSGERTIAVVVNPADLETVRGALGELGSQSAGAEHWDLQADQRVPAGGAIVRTDQSEVDARIETQLARAREVVEAEIGPRERAT